MAFNHLEIEKKWQQKWEQEKTFKTRINEGKKKFYGLDMFPYPSGAGLHVGHPLGYTANDIVCRMKRMQGYDVLHPMGWDAFGLPAEQYAIQTGNDPREFTLENIITFKRQLKMLGFSFDWDKEVDTSDPQYYKWTQFIFTELYNAGLAQLKEVEVNWCEELGTVLANDEIETNAKGEEVSERGGFPIVKRPMEQWVLNITKYADKLMAGLDGLNWPESTKEMQRNWIYDKETKELRLRDWTFSRQRFWGEPFPVKNGVVMSLDQLPLTHPKVKDFKANGGRPPLANSQEWLDAGYDLNTMPGAAGSSWYFLAYILKDENGYVPLNSPKAKELLNHWMPVDLYIGGPEHTVGHLLYSRFWNIFLSERGYLDVKEPFQKLVHQGMILGQDGQKMSKSKGNVINPDDIVNEFGADTLRAYVMFMGGFTDYKPWSTEGVVATRRWLERVWRLLTETVEFVDNCPEMEKPLHECIKKVTNDYEANMYNTAISAMMVFVNEAYKVKKMTKCQAARFVKLLNPTAPHLTSEIWETVLGKEKEISYSCWPTYDEAILVESEKEVVVQVNGKVRAKFLVSVDVKGNDLIAIAKTQENVIEHIKDKEIVKELVIQDKMVNIVVR